MTTDHTPDKKAHPAVSQLMGLVADDMAQVNELILSKAGSDVNMIPKIARHLIDSGGKRLRPMLTLATSQMCGYARGDKSALGEGVGHIKLATSVEFMHTATLLHDDVVDESDLRRGKSTARMLWGNQASVLVGDFLLGQAFRTMVEVGSMDALDVLSTSASVIAEGEVMQLAAAHKIQTSENEYLAVIRAKTAALFAAACELGPILGTHEPTKRAAERQALKEYGMNLGYAFQLIDDALDYGGSAATLGKNTGDDFREGKITLPVILAVARGSEEDKEFWAAQMSKGGSDDALDQAFKLLAEANALQDTMERAKHYGELAKQSLDLFDESAPKTALIDIVDFCISRAV